jgi:hypothetical protein
MDKKDTPLIVAVIAVMRVVVAAASGGRIVK